MKILRDLIIAPILGLAFIFFLPFAGLIAIGSVLLDYTLDVFDDWRR